MMDVMWAGWEWEGTATVYVEQTPELFVSNCKEQQNCEYCQWIVGWGWGVLALCM